MSASVPHKWELIHNWIKKNKNLANAGTDKTYQYLLQKSTEFDEFLKETYGSEPHTDWVLEYNNYYNEELGVDEIVTLLNSSLACAACDHQGNERCKTCTFGQKYGICGDSEYNEFCSEFDKVFMD